MELTDAAARKVGTDEVALEDGTGNLGAGAGAWTGASVGCGTLMVCMCNRQ